MTISWSFSYNLFVKFDGKKNIGEPQYDCVISKSCVLARCVIKPLYCMLLFDLILYIPSTIFQLCRDGSSWVEPVQS